MQSTGKPVEWQVARELRTTDWDRLRRTYAHEDGDIHSFRISSSSDGRSRIGLEGNERSYKSMSNLNHASHHESFVEAGQTERFTFRNVDISGTEQSKRNSSLLDS